MNFRILVAPALYGGVAAAVVAVAGYAVADWQSVTLFLPVVVYLLVGVTAVGLLAGSSSFSEADEDTEVHVDQDSVFSAPTEAEGPRRLLFICFFLALALAGVVGGVLFG